MKVRKLGVPSGGGGGELHGGDRCPLSTAQFKFCLSLLQTSASPSKLCVHPRSILKGGKNAGYSLWNSMTSPCCSSVIPKPGLPLDQTAKRLLSRGHPPVQA